MDVGFDCYELRCGEKP